jgi:predicted nucleic acid-binding protein
LSESRRFLIDTSTWIETLRPSGEPAVRARVRDLTTEDRAVFCDLVRVGEMLREHMQAGATYEEARRQFFSIAPRPLGTPGVPLPSREDVHDRASLR